MPKRVLLVAATTGYQTRVFEETANRMGLEVVLGIDRCVHLEGSWGKHAVPVRFEKPDEAAALLAETNANGVVAVGDRPTEIASLAASAMGLPFHPHDAVLACRNKFLARERFRAAGLRVPRYSYLPPHVETRPSYPCVVKPLHLSGSRGVIRANDEAEFCEAVHRVRRMLPEQVLLVESYIPGREFAVEGIVTKGELQPFAIFDKPDPLEGPFFEETLYVTPSRETDAVQRALIEATQAGVRALGLWHGPIHAEMRYNDEGVWLLEIAARPIGGLCAGSLRFEGALKLEEVILRHALGEDIRHIRRERGASGVMMIPVPASGIYNSVSGVEDAAVIPYIEDLIITAQPGQRLLKLPEGASYLGFIFARAETPDDVERALRAAHTVLRFDVATELPVMRPA